MIFVIDEDLPRSTAKILRVNGFEVYDIRDHGLRDHADEAILSFATQESHLEWSDAETRPQTGFPFLGKSPRVVGHLSGGQVNMR